MLSKAKAELEKVPKRHRQHPAWMQLRVRLAMEEEDWGVAASIAREQRERSPNEPAYWIQWAYATRRRENIEAARSILEEAVRRFPKEAVIPFNLACYECQLGHADKARQYLEQAFSLNPDCRRMALEDEDLKPLWDDLPG